MAEAVAVFKLSHLQVQAGEPAATQSNAWPHWLGAQYPIRRQGGSGASVTRGQQGAASAVLG